MNLLRYLYRVFFLNVDQLISLTEILYREKIIQKNKEHSAHKNKEQWSLWKLVVIWFLFFFPGKSTAKPCFFGELIPL